MIVSTDIKQNCLIARPKGELDMHSVPEFKEKIIKLMEEHDIKLLILNCKDIKFIDSTGVGAILGRYRSLDKVDGQITLVGLNPQIKRIFKLSGILKLLPVYENELDALNQLQTKGGYKFA